MARRVERVKIQSDALQVCIAHALSTEREEVMGLLIGEIPDDGIPHIYTAIILRRLDKRKDRVEISSEQLSKASTQAEELGMYTHAKRPMRIIGWYHSHPHITVWPSHVDVRTQEMYQMMDRDFVGLIVSCFNSDALHLGQIQATCFQAERSGSSIKRVDTPLEIIPCQSICNACFQALSSLPQSLLEEEKDAYSQSLSFKDQDLITAVKNASVFTKAIMEITEIICSPIIHNMEITLEGEKAKLKKAEDHRNILKARLLSLGNYEEDMAVT